MALQNLLGDITLEATQQELLGSVVVLLSAMLEKMPRVTGNDQAAVSIEAGSVAVSGGTMTAVTTVNTVADQRAQGGQFISGANTMLAGTQHIYSNIVVS